MKLYTVLFALFLFNIAYVFAGENLAIEKSELSRRIMKRYLEKDSVQKMEKRLQGILL
jgi:hypothetical protein